VQNMASPHPSFVQLFPQVGVVADRVQEAGARAPVRSIFFCMLDVSVVSWHERTCAAPWGMVQRRKGMDSDQERTYIAKKQGRVVAVFCAGLKVVLVIAHG